MLGWGSTWGVDQRGGAPRARRAARRSAHAHLVHLNPFPPNLGEVLARYPKVLVPEMNLGQLSKLVRAEFLVDAEALTKVQGLPFRAAEIESRDPGDDRCRRRVDGTTTAATAVKLGRKDFQSDQEVRWCPGCGDYSILAAMQLLLARARRAARRTWCSCRASAARPVPVLHEHLRRALHPRPRARGRHRRRAGASRPRRVGDHRRRRRAVDRRQPPDPRAAPQRQPQDPDVQQPDLRAHQGPVLADERGRARSRSRRRSARSTTRSTRCRSRSAPRRRSWPAPTTWTAST